MHADPIATPNFRPVTTAGAGITALAAALALTACGGGGGGSGAALPVTTPSTPTTPTTPTTPPVAGSRITCNLTNFQTEMLAAVNARRRAGASCGTRGTFPAAADLTWNAQLTQAAVAHSDDMVANNFFDHTGSSGSTLGTRATAAGYAWSGLGENIAAGQTSVSQVVDGWMKSDGHCANLMNAGFRDIGVACVSGGSGNTYRTYWTQDFGTPR